MCTRSSISVTVYTHDISEATHVENMLMGSILTFAIGKHGRHHHAMMCMQHKFRHCVDRWACGRILPNS